MSAFEWNKVIGAVLVALLVIKVADIGGNMIIHAKIPEQHAFPIAGVERAPTDGAPGPAEVQIADIKPMLADASVERGQQAARRCAVCHTFEKGGPNKIGPNLYGIVGDEIGHGREGFNFSAALRNMDGTWDYDKLNEFLFNPRAFAPGNRMAFAGVRDDAERAALIAYMRSLADSPAPLP